MPTRSERTRAVRAHARNLLRREQSLRDLGIRTRRYVRAEGEHAKGRSGDRGERSRGQSRIVTISAARSNEHRARSPARTNRAGLGRRIADACRRDDDRGADATAERQRAELGAGEAWRSSWCILVCSCFRCSQHFTTFRRPTRAARALVGGTRFAPAGRACRPHVGAR